MLHKPAAEMHSTKLKPVGSSRFVHSTPCRDSISPSSIVWEGSNESCQENTFNHNSAVVAEDAVRKITALEDELNKLRAQIAGFVLNQEDPITSKATPEKHLIISSAMQISLQLDHEAWINRCPGK